MPRCRVHVLLYSYPHSSESRDKYLYGIQIEKKRPGLQRQPENPKVRFHPCVPAIVAVLEVFPIPWVLFIRIVVIPDYTSIGAVIELNFPRPPINMRVVLLQPVMPDKATMLLDALGVPAGRRTLADAAFARSEEGAVVFGDVRPGVRLFDVDMAKL